MMIQRNTDGGFTVRDILTVLALLGAAALAAPSARSEASAPGQGFADQVVRELQRARGEAVATGVPRHALVYSNRVEIRAARRGAGRTWIAPSEMDPALRTVRAKLGVRAVDVTSRTGLPSFVLSETFGKEIVFGAGGTGALSPAGAAHLYISNDTVSDDHAERVARVDIAARTGVATVKRGW
jgi:Tfp pilus assembly protein FimT